VHKCGPGVETQVSIGTYRPYCMTLYWHLLQCGHLHNFCAFRIFCTFYVFALSQFLHFCTFAYLMHFTFSCMLHILCSSHSHALMRATMRLPRIHRIPFVCPVLVLQGPLVRISLCFTHIISYMSLHFHLCSLISLFVYITSPLYV